MSPPRKFEKPTCPKCGSDEVACDSNSTWNVYHGRWETESAYDAIYCSACEKESKFADWVDVPASELNINEAILPNDRAST